jgi:hypothetical protein
MSLDGYCAPYNGQEIVYLPSGKKYRIKWRNGGEETCYCYSVISNTLVGLENLKTKHRFTEDVYKIEWAREVFFHRSHEDFKALQKIWAEEDQRFFQALDELALYEPTSDEVEQVDKIIKDLVVPPKKDDNE